jgi:hypothetical protein
VSSEPIPRGGGSGARGACKSLHTPPSGRRGSYRRRGRNMHNPLPLLLVTFVVAALASPAVGARAPAPPSLTASVTSGRVVTPVAVSLSGTIACTASAHFRIYSWLAQPVRATIGRGSIPPRLATGSAIEAAHWHALTTCTGRPQHWELRVTALGKHPSGFAAGPARACLIAYAETDGLYTLVQTCAYPRLAL